ncbi:MAG: hypothetical protein LBU66_03530, partial [Treponema sp.]|nr:hypothetical protein [Treponema sp.]
FNLDIQQKCETLSNYSYFINKIREYQKDELSLANSVENAIKYCVENNILKDFLKEHGSEVVSMLFYDYDIDTHISVAREEEREEIARNALTEGVPFEIIQKITGLAPDVIRELQKEGS